MTHHVIEISGPHFSRITLASFDNQHDAEEYRQDLKRRMYWRCLQVIRADGAVVY